MTRSASGPSSRPFTRRSHSTVPASLFAAAATDDVRYAALDYQAHYSQRYVIDAIEAAQGGAPPR